MNEFFNSMILGNTILDYLFVLGIIFISWIVLKFSRKKFITMLKKLTANTSNKFDDLIVDMVDKFVLPYTFLLINYNAISQLTLPILLRNIFSIAAMFVTFYFGVRLLNFIIQHLVVVAMKSRKETDERIRQVQGMLIVLKAIIWCGGLVMLADNLGYNVTTIIAGLGVGGIAIALAAQSILGDLFSYIVIFFDKPFEIGDFIIANNYMGVVEKIGIKTSHVRSLDGQQLVMPNTEMVKTVIQNYKRLERRRVVFGIGVVYNTSASKLRAIPGFVKNIINDEENAEFDRANFKSFGDFSVNYEIVYYIPSADYLLYMNTQEKICMNIFEKFEEEEIEFAFPTQTIYFNKVKEPTSLQSMKGPNRHPLVRSN